jgi:hypothetical protein
VPELLVSDALRPIAEEYRQDVVNIASDYPALKEEAAVLFEFIGTAAARDYDVDAHDGVLVNGQTPGAQLWNEARCRAQLSTRYDQSQADSMIKAASDEWQRLPDKVKAYLDADMGAGARLGNHPAVVAGLALRKYAQLSPERGRAELAQRREGKGYGQGGALEKDILHILGIIAARGQSAQPQPRRHRARHGARAVRTRSPRKAPRHRRRCVRSWRGSMRQAPTSGRPMLCAASVRWLGGRNFSSSSEGRHDPARQVRREKGQRRGRATLEAPPEMLCSARLLTPGEGHAAAG